MHNILILGGGFGGVRCALDLNKSLKNRDDVKITLIDKNSGQTFYPALYEVASMYGMKGDDDFNNKKKKLVELPYSKIFSGSRVDFVQAEISNINLNQKFVATSGGTVIDFDYLVMAMGAISSDFGIPGVQEYAYMFKSTEDAIAVNTKLTHLFKEVGERKRSLPIRIIVAGGGFTGVELASELVSTAEYIAHGHINELKGCASVAILEAGPSILPMIPEKERLLVQKRLQDLDIQTVTNSPITEVVSEGVILKNKQRMMADLVIWSTGNTVPELITNIHGLDLDERGRIKVNDFLQTNHEHVFGLGDCAIIIDPATRKPVPQLAYTAIDQGRIIAENIKRRIIGRRISTQRSSELSKYKPKYETWIAPVGGKYAIAHLGKGRTYDGILGYILREGVDLRYYMSIMPFFSALGLFLKDILAFSKND